MAELVAIVGPPGRGKSTAIYPHKELGIKGLNLDETVIVNVSGKPLSMRGWKKKFKLDPPVSKGGNYVVLHESDYIVKLLEIVDEQRPKIKNVVIEDAQYLMAFATMQRAREKGYDKWNIIGQIGFAPVEKAKDLKRDDLIVWFIYHEEKADDGEMKIKTAGRLIDSTITLEGLFTTILFAQMDLDPSTKKPRYFFITNADGTVKARSRYGTFTDLRIPNDLGLVRDAIDTYNEGE